jgi:DNA-binding NtrC family response regulator
MKQLADALPPRSDRKPLSVRVITDPQLPGCWSTNVSLEGMGLIAHAASPSEGPAEGASVLLEWTFPGERTRLRARGEVRWRQDGVDEDRAGPRVAMGIRFERLEGGGATRLARYLEAFRERVVVLGAPRDAALRLQRALPPDVQSLLLTSLDDFDEVLRRGDVGAVVVAGATEDATLAALESALVHLARARLQEERPPDGDPPFLLWGPALPDRLVELFNDGRLFRALAPACDATALREAILAAISERRLRLERARVALELKRRRLRERELQAPAAPLGEPLPGFQSPAMSQVMAQIQVVAPHRVPLLLQGETGTGKEVLARIVHRLSPRAAAAFVAQDCGALPEALLESELFGHVRGAFTGATADHPGLFVLADGGTLFLDEIENTPVSLQAKLLRVIETGEVRPVGGTTVRQVDVRIIVAGNRVLEEEVEAGRFRRDLFFRLNTFVVDVPPLRQRREDVLPLAHHFIELFNASLGRRVRGLSEEAQALLLALEWRGNVRELRNVIERAVLLSGPDGWISPSHFPAALVARAGHAGDPNPSLPGSFTERLAQAERQILREALERNDGVIRRAALDLRMDPVTFGRRARKQGLLEHPMRLRPTR